MNAKRSQMLSGEIDLPLLISVGSHTDYQRERKVRGTQAEVAEALDVERETVSRRETGDSPISRESWLALLALPQKAKAQKRIG